MFEFALGLGQKSGRLIRRFSVPFSSPDQAAFLHFCMFFRTKPPPTRLDRNFLYEKSCKSGRDGAAASDFAKSFIQNIKFQGFF